jgi:hypothetical protein
MLCLCILCHAVHCVELLLQLQLQLRCVELLLQLQLRCVELLLQHAAETEIWRCTQPWRS